MYKLLNYYQYIFALRDNLQNLIIYRNYNIDLQI